MVFAIGFILGAGPFIAIAFSLTWPALRDEKAFWEELSLWISAVKPTEDFRKDLIQSLDEMKSFIDPRWLEQHKPKAGKLNAKVIPLEETNIDEAELFLMESGIWRVAGDFRSCR